MDQPLLTIKEVRALLRISLGTFHKLRQVNGLPASKIGGRWKIDRDKLNRWLASAESVN